MSEICFFFVFFIEQFISYMFFSKRYKTEKHPVFILSAFVISFIVQYLINFSGISELNLISFFIANSLIAILCFSLKPLSAILNTILLEVTMVSSEFVTMAIFSVILHQPLNAYQTSVYSLFIDALTTKSLYFFIVYLIVSLSKGKKKEEKGTVFSLLLSILPAVSVIIMIGFRYVSIHCKPDNNAYIIITVLSLLLLSANLAILFIYEKTVLMLTMNSELLLEKKKNDVDKEYYSELERRFETGNILVHDIKGQLNAIRDISNEESVKDMVDSVLNNKDLIPMKQYSKNKLINVIVSRFSYLSDDYQIDFYVDIRDAAYELIEPSVLTMILDNLLMNAVEAVQKSQEKNISLYMGLINENYVQIKVGNSCDKNPFHDNKELQSTKRDSSGHGYGIKSIKRAINRLHGKLTFSFSEENRFFSATVICPMQKE